MRPRSCSAPRSRTFETSQPTRSARLSVSRAAWIGAVAVTALLAVLWPVLLLPLFLRSEPLSDGPLADALWDTVHVKMTAQARARPRWSEQASAPPMAQEL